MFHPVLSAFFSSSGDSDGRRRGGGGRRRRGGARHGDGVIIIIICCASASRLSHHHRMRRSHHRLLDSSRLTTGNLTDLLSCYLLQLLTSFMKSCIKMRKNSFINCLFFISLKIFNNLLMSKRFVYKLYIFNLLKIFIHFFRSFLKCIFRIKLKKILINHKIIFHFISIFSLLLRTLFFKNILKN